jgi:hypothetical protein
MEMAIPPHFRYLFIAPAKVNTCKVTKKNWNKDLKN